jgi:antitoxin VapB
MALSIKNDETEALARKLAGLTGESLTETIRISLVERYDRLKRSRSGRSLADELNQIALRCARRPVISNLTPDQILGYDRRGIPSR